jgi:UPF0042 nucleotide-binding protein
MDNTLTLFSFSFRLGLPEAADMVVDARFLKNPFYEPSLSKLTGLNKAAGDYIETDAEFAGFFSRLTALLLPLLPRYFTDERKEFTFAIGCTGGQHRSVYVVEKLAAFFRDKGYKVSVQHRDLKR